jgi:hypothetical protein
VIHASLISLVPSLAGLHYYYRLEARASFILLFIIINWDAQASIIIIELRLEPHALAILIINAQRLT